MLTILFYMYDLQCALAVQVLVPTTVTIAQKPVTTKKDPVLIRAKDAEEGVGPTTTVFVGNISEKASDMLVRQLLAVSSPYVADLSELN